MPASEQHKIDFEKFVFDARPDTVDFRDRMYEPTLVEVPTEIPLGEYQNFAVPVLHQGQEGACTGFGLATVANYLHRKRKVVPDKTPVSPRMLYEMAKRYDEWPGENYQGSSARGAMKGWHKHGVCAGEVWPYDPKVRDTTLTYDRSADAARRPLGAYLRVNHKNLVAMHSALAEVGILMATSWVHDGWLNIKENGEIPFDANGQIMGGHAFAIVAYDARGFWIQNSWGMGWGKDGFARISYDDWLVNGLDVWVARLGVPVSLRVAGSAAAKFAPGAAEAKSYTYSDLRPHIITLGERGQLAADSTFGTVETDIAAIFAEDIPRITRDWDKKRLLLYAPGGLVKAKGFHQRMAEYRAAMLNAKVYLLTFFWHEDFWATISNTLQEAIRQRRPEGSLSGKLDFMLDRLDDTLEPLVHTLAGKTQWDEVKKKAHRATLDENGGARLVIKYLAEWFMREPDAEVHIVAHGAGSILGSPLVKLLTSNGKIRSGYLRGTNGFGIPVSSCSLWAPSIRLAEFKQTYAPAIRMSGIQRFTLYTLNDEAEQDDNCAQIYNRSLLYLISNALEDKPGEPLLGMARYSKKDRTVAELLKSRAMEWVQAPNNAPENSRWASTTRRHGDFDDDAATLRSTLVRILQSWEGLPEFDFHRSEDSLQEKRTKIDDMTS